MRPSSLSLAETEEYLLIELPFPDARTRSLCFSASSSSLAFSGAARDHSFARTCFLQRSCRLPNRTAPRWTNALTRLRKVSMLQMPSPISSLMTFGHAPRIARSAHGRARSFSSGDMSLALRRARRKGSALPRCCRMVQARPARLSGAAGPGSADEGCEVSGIARGLKSK